MNLRERLSQDFALQQEARLHYVYHLTWKGKVVYVGRSFYPKARRTAFERKHGFRPAQKIFAGQTLDEACKRERADIRRLSPKYNIYVASSPCNLNHAQSDNQKRIVSLATRGRKLTVAHKAKLWRERPRPIGKLNWFFGKKHTPETIAKIRVAAIAQFADPIKRERTLKAARAGIERRKALGLPLGRPKGVPWTDEARANLRAGIRRRIDAGLSFGRIK